MADHTVYVYLGTYESEDAAREDLAAIQEQHSRGFIGTYDAAVIVKDEQGKVSVRKHEKPTQHGVAAGVAAGAVVGLLFPPALIGSVLVGGAAGGLIGHFRRGMSRHDVTELGDFRRRTGRARATSWPTVRPPSSSSATTSTRSASRSAWSAPGSARTRPSRSTRRSSSRRCARPSRSSRRGLSVRSPGAPRRPHDIGAGSQRAVLNAPILAHFCAIWQTIAQER